jgi:GAF domain-containing protein
MDKLQLAMRLEELRNKQSLLNDAWEKTSNHKLLDLFVQMLPRTLDVERCSIFILDPEENNVWLHCGTDVAQRQISVPKWSSMVGSVIDSGECKIDYDMDQNPGYHDMVDFETGFRTKNALCVPIRGVTTGKVTGAIQVLNKLNGQKYSEDDRALLETIAFHIQMDIENMYLRQETIKISREIGNKISLFEANLNRTFYNKS